MALLIFADELGVPIGMPAELALLLIGSYAVHSVPALLGSLALVAAADVLGTTGLHLMVRTGGRHLLGVVLGQQGGPQQAARIERWRARLGRHDVLIVFVVRLLPVARVSAPVAAGLLSIRFRDFLLGAILGAFVWAGIPLTLGYLLRADVQQLAARYTWISHSILLALPVLALIAILSWWVSRGDSLRTKARRARSGLGLVVVVVTVGYLIEIARENARAAQQRLLALPYPFLILWLTLLAGLAGALLVLAIADLRAARRLQGQPVRTRLTATELTMTLVWVSLVCGVGAIILGIEMHYPAL